MAIDKRSSSVFMHNGVDDATEQTPLLPTSDTSHNITHVSTSDIANQDPRNRPWTPLAFSIALFAIIFMLGTSDQLIAPARTRVIESIYCNQYYSDRNHISSNSTQLFVARYDGLSRIPEDLCKVPEIQGKVALLQAWQTALDYFVSLLVTPFWAWVADRWGRRPVLILIFCAFMYQNLWIQGILYIGDHVDIHFIWFSALHALAGGGAAVAVALFYTIISDVYTEAARVKAYFRLSAGGLVSRMLTPPLSSFLMRKSPWLAMSTGVLLIMVGLLLVIAIPETIHYSRKPHEPPTNDEESSSTQDDLTGGKPTTITQRLFQSINFVTTDRRILTLIPMFSLHILLINNEALLLQYPSSRFGLSLSDSTLLGSIRSGFSLGLYIFILPLLSSYLTESKRYSPAFKDLTLGRYSGAITAVGLFGIGLAPSLWLFCIFMAIMMLGGGFMLFLRALITSLVEPHHVARLNAMISVADTMGVMVGSPGMAWLFEKGLSIGCPGLCWLALGAVVTLVYFVLSFIWLTENEKHGDIMVTPSEEAIQG